MNAKRITNGTERTVIENMLDRNREFARHAGHGDILREQIDQPVSRQPNP